MSALHYAGELTFRTARGGITQILGGWAACCSGDRARKIRATGQNTRDRSKITCKACLRQIERADAYERARHLEIQKARQALAAQWEGQS